jgi:hypothetical protein
MDFIITGRRSTPHPGDNSDTPAPPVHYHGVFIFNSIIIQEDQSGLFMFSRIKEGVLRGEIRCHAKTMLNMAFEISKITSPGIFEK